MNGVEHQFTEEEKNFVVQFAFRSGSKEDTICLIEALGHSADKAESDEIMVTYRAIRNKYGYTQNDMAESLDVSYIHYSQIEQGRHRMSLELMLKIVTKYGVDPNTLFGIESREKHENKDLSVLEDKLQMLKPNDREYAMSTCLIFIEGLEARKEVV